LNLVKTFRKKVGGEKKLKSSVQIVFDCFAREIVSIKTEDYTTDT